MKKSVDVSWCYMCICSGEDVDHLLLYCIFATCLWWEVLNLFGIQWVMSSTVKEVFHSWNFKRRKRRSKVWDVIPLALMWVVWRKRELSKGSEWFVHVKDSLLSLVSFVAEMGSCLYRWVGDFCREPYFSVGFSTSYIRGFPNINKIIYLIKKKLWGSSWCGKITCCHYLGLST